MTQQQTQGGSPPFARGAIIRDEDGLQYRVLRAYVPPEPGYMDCNAVELVRVSPHKPFRLAAALVRRWMEASP